MIIENKNANQSLTIKVNKTTSGSMLTMQNTNGSLDVLTITDAGIFSTVAGAIVSNSIADSAITGSKLAANCITSDKISPGTIIESDVGTGAVHIGLYEISTFQVNEATITYSDWDGQYIIIEDDVGTVAFWIDVDNSGTTEPVHGAARSVEITTLTTEMTKQDAANAIAAAIDADSKFAAVSDNVDLVTITASTTGTKQDITSSITNSKSVVAVTTQGSLSKIANFAANQLIIGTGTSTDPVYGLINTANITDNSVTVSKIEDASSNDQVLLTGTGTTNPAWGKVALANCDSTLTNQNLTTTTAVTFANITGDNITFQNTGSSAPVAGKAYLLEQQLAINQTTMQTSISSLTLTGSLANTYIYGIADQTADITLAASGTSTATGACIGIAKHFAENAGEGNVQRVQNVCASVTVVGNDSASDSKKAEAIHEFLQYDNGADTDQKLKRISYINTSGGFSTASDVRFKSNVQSLPQTEQELQKLLKVQVSTYQLHQQQHQEIGVIAQDIREDFRLATSHKIHKDGKECIDGNCWCKYTDQYLFVDYSKLPLYHLNAFQYFYKQEHLPLLKRLSELEEAVADLKAKQQQYIHIKI